MAVSTTLKLVLFAYERLYIALLRGHLQIVQLYVVGIKEASASPVNACAVIFN